jgi:hypothetical protein
MPPLRSALSKSASSHARKHNKAPLVALSQNATAEDEREDEVSESIEQQPNDEGRYRKEAFRRRQQSVDESSTLNSQFEGAEGQQDDTTEYHDETIFD